MESKFSISGHPLHPALVALPIGLFVWAFVSDIVYISTDKDKMWYDISFWTGIAAIATAAVAALPGIGDFLTMARESEARSTAITHGLLNVIVVLLYTIAAILMMDENAIDGGQLTTVAVLHGVGVATLAVSGWLGGEMVYRNHLAVVPESTEVEQQERARHAHRPQPRPR